MIASINMADVANVRRKWFISPATAAEKKLLFGSELRGTNKEFFNSRFAVGKAIAQKRKIAQEAGVGVYRKVNVGIERVIDGDAVASTDFTITAGYGPASPIREHKREFGKQGMERIGWICGDAVECRRGIDIPKHFANGSGQGGDAGFEKLVENAYPACLDNNVR
jgi:hypothetical protein